MSRVPQAASPSAWTTGRSQRNPELRHSPVLHWHLQPRRRTVLDEETSVSGSFCTCYTQTRISYDAQILLSRALPPSVTYLCRSKARTVPSRDALTMTKPLEVKVTLVTLLVCSVKVTKQRPLLEFHTFTWGNKLITTPIHKSAGWRPKSAALYRVFMLEN